MNKSEANQAVQEILNALIPLGLAPAGTPFILPGGGQLNPEPHPELASYWRPIWRPAQEGLSPRDFEGWPARWATVQIARYRHPGYVTLRRRLDDMMRVLAEESIESIDSHGTPDSHILGRYGVSISEQTRGAREPAYTLMLRPSPIPEVVELGEEIPGPPDVDATDRTSEEILTLLRARAG